MLLVLFRFQILPCVWNDTEKQIFRGVIYCSWLNDCSIFHPPLFFLDLSYFMSVNLHFEQYYIIAIRVYVLLYFLNFRKILISGFCSPFCSPFLAMQYCKYNLNVNQLLSLRSFTSCLSRKKPDTDFRLARNSSSVFLWNKTRCRGGKQQNKIF